ncbi:MAG: glycosyltransferase [Rhodospirillales bacterium]|nr:glycosyltransferase [Rhodospirillales bacterium]
MKLLILIVAYNHEAEIESVLSRIPESLRAHETEVLILDDSSKDKTFEKSAAYAKEKSFPSS